MKMNVLVTWIPQKIFAKILNEDNSALCIIFFTHLVWKPRSRMPKSAKGQ